MQVQVLYAPACTQSKADGQHIQTQQNSQVRKNCSLFHGLLLYLSLCNENARSLNQPSAESLHHHTTFENIAILLKTQDG